MAKKIHKKPGTKAFDKRVKKSIKRTSGNLKMLSSNPEKLEQILNDLFFEYRRDYREIRNFASAKEVIKFKENKRKLFSLDKTLADFENRFMHKRAELFQKINLENEDFNEIRKLYIKRLGILDNFQLIHTNLSPELKEVLTLMRKYSVRVLKGLNKIINKK